MQDFQQEKSEIEYYIEMVDRILADMRKSVDQTVAKYEEEARLKKLALTASSPEELSQELAERTVSKVHIFHDNQIEIESFFQDAFAGVHE